LSHKFEKIEFTDEYIGPHLLESITKGLYVDPLHTIREYVQNEIEAIPPATKIKILLGDNEISISGNGGGMNKQDIIENALKIGFSLKDPSANYGFRGIGLWSGIAVCDTIWITTKKIDHDKKYTVRINAAGIRKEIFMKKNKLTKVLSDNVELDELYSPVGPCGTLVRLASILEESKKYLLNKQDVKDYLSLVLPIKFDPNFKYKEEIEEKLVKNVSNYRTVNLYLGEEQIYRSPFYNELERPEFEAIRFNSKNLAYAWYCLNTYNKIIPEKNSRSFLYKKFGFSVGNREIYLDWWKKSRHLVDWCVGEIHVIDTNILPNSERTNFENSIEKDRLLEQLKIFANN
jgi:molecular chaperone HtpG